MTSAPESGVSWLEASRVTRQTSRAFSGRCMASLPANVGCNWNRAFSESIPTNAASSQGNLCLSDAFTLPELYRLNTMGSGSAAIRQ